MAGGEVCDQVTKLADRVFEIAVAMERVTEKVKSLDDQQHAQGNLISRMAASEQDRLAIHAEVAQIRENSTWALRLAITTLTGVVITMVHTFLSK